MANLIKAKHFGQFLVRAGVPIGAFALCLHWLAPHLTASLWAGFPQQLSNISAGAWAMAIALTALSLWSVGRYDGVAHQHFQTRVPQHQARAAGTISIALAQTLGFGIFTGTLARWRMLRGISLGTSLKLSTFVSITFMISWAIVAAISCLNPSRPGLDLLSGPDRNCPCTTRVMHHVSLAKAGAKPLAYPVPEPKSQRCNLSMDPD
jgi:phosphatidylglycerol lysyltransferase